MDGRLMLFESIHFAFLTYITHLTVNPKIKLVESVQLFW